MGEILILVLTNFWPFCAAVILLGTALKGIAAIVAACKSGSGSAVE